MSKELRIVRETGATAPVDLSPDERLTFERLLADLSARFANIPGAAVESEIERGLRQLIAFLGYERSSFFEFDADGTLITLCSVAVPGVELVPVGAAFGRELTWYAGELRAGRVILQPSLPDGLPAEAVAENEYVRRIGMRSNLTIPLSVGGRVIGALAFGAFRATAVWPDDLIARIRMVGEVFAQAVARKRADTQLAVAMAEIKRLKDRLEEENAYLRDAVHETPEGGLASHSPAFKRVLEEVAQVARTPSTVLLQGETGSGKEVVARAIHDLSDRRSRPMVKVNCAALPANLIEAELFGREKGAYTGALARQMGRFELADGATIFLDEVGELPLELQSKLLRVLQDGEFERLGGTRTIKVDARVIAATNRDLARAMEDGTFRKDLFYRLNVFPIEVPPLRERREDIPMLVWTFVRQFSETLAKPITTIDATSMAALQEHSWPGNVRELRNVIERAMILSRHSTLHVSLDPPFIRMPAIERPAVIRDEAERMHLFRILERCGWRIRGPKGAAAALDMKPTTLESRMKKLGLERPGQHSEPL